MPKPGTQRVVGLPLARKARSLLRAAERAEVRLAEAKVEAEDARGALNRMHTEANRRLGVDVPRDALLLDVLELVDVEDGNRWTWRGTTNNKQLATVKADGREMSLVRFLAIAFGIIDETWQGLLYPTDNDTEDVNPWHRQLRESDAPLGNPKRFTF